MCFVICETWLSEDINTKDVTENKKKQYPISQHTTNTKNMEEIMQAHLNDVIIYTYANN